ncbi:uncharacterized protein ARMOST_04140 [Armillaria ostoyae]|uniref:Uncharacterized protein n=1 Tax=Armillaria ostoyae TaxID=47428 RepID=A0A284QWH3_ARMOS|nr:uncharacterized protein ARMOST_04140 [Armillaria ostoyae]
MPSAPWTAETPQRLALARKTRRGRIFSPYSPESPIVLPGVSLRDILQRRAAEAPPNGEREEDIRLEPRRSRAPRCSARIFDPPLPPASTRAHSPAPYVYDPSIPPEICKKIKKKHHQSSRRMAATAAASPTSRHHIKAITIDHLLHAEPIKRSTAPQIANT